MLQVPELKRAMGLPEGFRLNHGTRRDRIRLLGNGVLWSAPRELNPSRGRPKQACDKPEKG